MANDQNETVVQEGEKMVELHCHVCLYFLYLSLFTPLQSCLLKCALTKG